MIDSSILAKGSGELMIACILIGISLISGLVWLICYQIEKRFIKPKKSYMERLANEQRNAVLDEVKKMVLDGCFLHDQAPGKLFANQIAKAIDQMKRN